MGTKSERRTDQRQGFVTPALIKIRGGESESKLRMNTRDISSSGLFLQGSSQIEVGTEMEVSLEIPLELLRNVKSRTASLTLNGEVVRVSGDGIAISFTEDRVPGILRPVDKS